MEAAAAAAKMMPIQIDDDEQDSSWAPSKMVDT